MDYAFSLLPTGLGASATRQPRPKSRQTRTQQWTRSRFNARRGATAMMPPAKHCLGFEPAGPQLVTENQRVGAARTWVSGSEDEGVRRSEPRKCSCRG